MVRHCSSILEYWATNTWPICVMWWLFNKMSTWASWLCWRTITWQGGWSSACSQLPSGLLPQRPPAGGGGGRRGGRRRRPSSGWSGSSGSSRRSPAPASYWSLVRALLVELSWVEYAPPPKVDDVYCLSQNWDKWAQLSLRLNMCCYLFSPFFFII